MSGKGKDSQLEAIQSFGDEGTMDIFFGDNTKKARRTIPKPLHSKAQEIMDAFNRGADPMRLMIYEPEQLQGHENWYSLRINQQFRIVCIWDNENNFAYRVTATDYHD